MAAASAWCARGGEGGGGHEGAAPRHHASGAAHRSAGDGAALLHVRGRPGGALQPQQDRLTCPQGESSACTKLDGARRRRVGSCPAGGRRKSFPGALPPAALTHRPSHAPASGSTSHRHPARHNPSGSARAPRAPPVRLLHQTHLDSAFPAVPSPPKAPQSGASHGICSAHLLVTRPAIDGALASGPLCATGAAYRRRWGRPMSRLPEAGRLRRRWRPDGDASPAAPSAGAQAQPFALLPGQYRLRFPGRMACGVSQGGRGRRWRRRRACMHVSSGTSLHCMHAFPFPCRPAVGVPLREPAGAADGQLPSQRADGLGPAAGAAGDGRAHQRHARAPRGERQQRQRRGASLPGPCSACRCSRCRCPPSPPLPLAARLAAAACVLAPTQPGPWAAPAPSRWRPLARRPCGSSGW